MENSQNQARENSAEKRILQAAMDEFMEKGQNGARMESIANRAGVNKALIHYYYRNKQKLYHAVLEDTMGQVWAAMEKSFSGIDENADIRSIIRLLVSTYINVLGSSPAFPQLFLRELADGGGIIPSLIQGIMSRYGHLAASIFSIMKKGIQTGQLRPIDPMHVVINVLSMCAASFVLKPVIANIHQNLFHKELAFDEKFFSARITAITEMTLEGIVAKGGVR